VSDVPRANAAQKLQAGCALAQAVFTLVLVIVGVITYFGYVQPMQQLAQASEKKAQAENDLAAATAKLDATNGALASANTSLADVQNRLHAAQLEIERKQQRFAIDEFTIEVLAGTAARFDQTQSSSPEDLLLKFGNGGTVSMYMEAIERLIKGESEANLVPFNVSPSDPGAQTMIERFVAAMNDRVKARDLIDVGLKQVEEDVLPEADRKPFADRAAAFIASYPDKAIFDDVIDERAPADAHRRFITAMLDMRNAMQRDVAAMPESH
jgi:hypothetical protein